MGRTFLILSLVGALLAGVGYFTWNQDPKGFPVLSPGSYVGFIEESDGERTTLYVERFREEPLLLFVVFKDGWVPQTTRLVSADSQTVSPNPVRLEFPQGELVFTGAKKNGQVMGSVDGPGEISRQWSLKAVPRAEMSVGDVALRSQASKLQQWLRLRLGLRKEQLREQSLREKLEEVGSNIETLKSNLEDEESLKARAKLQYTKLQEKVSQARTERKEVRNELRKLVRELELLERIKESGKLVRLARKLSTRENKWYLAHWTTGEDATRVEEFLGDRLKIDVRTLEGDAQKARQIRGFLRQISEEKARIAELQEMYRSRVSGGVVSPRDRQEVERGQQDEDGNTIWDRFF